MPADIVIRGGTVFDGSGAPGRAADVAIADGVIREIGPNLHGEARARRVRAARSRPASSTSTRTTTRRCSGIRRCGRRRTTASPRWSPATAASPSRPPAPSTATRSCGTLENVEDMDPATLAAGIAWEFETFPEYLDGGAPARHRAQLHRVRRALRAAALRDGRRRLRARRHRRRDRAHVPARRARRSTPARPGSRPASRTRTAASTASRCRAASPSATRSRRCSVAAGDAGQGRGADHARASSAPTPTCTSGSRRSGGPFTYPLFASPGGKHLDAGRAARAGLVARRQGVAAGHAAAADDAVHDGRRVQPQHRHGVRRAHEGRPRGAPRRVPRSRRGGRARPPTSSSRR